MKSINFGVIIDMISTDIIKFELSTRLSKLKKEDVQELVEFLAQNDSNWIGVLDGKRAAVLFDEETRESIRINDGIVKLELF